MANEVGQGKGQEEIAATKRQEAFDLRRRGKTYRQIAAILNISHQTAFEYVKGILDELHKQTLEEGKKYVAIELQRLDLMYAAIEEKANNGDTEAQEMAIKILQRRAKYLGMDAPEKKEISGEISLKEMISKSAELKIINETPKEKKTEKT